MEMAIIDGVIKQGFFAALFVWLLWKTQAINEKRELEYQKVITKNQKVIEEQSKAFTSLSRDVNEIKQILTDDKGE
jgi:hypothetical protein